MLPGIENQLPINPYIQFSPVLFATPMHRVLHAWKGAGGLYNSVLSIPGSNGRMPVSENSDPATAIRISGAIRTAIMSLVIVLHRTPVSNDPLTMPP